MDPRVVALEAAWAEPAETGGDGSGVAEAGSGVGGRGLLLEGGVAPAGSSGNHLLLYVSLCTT